MPTCMTIHYGEVHAHTKYVFEPGGCICDGRDPPVLQALVFQEIRLKLFGSSKRGGSKRDLWCRQRCNCSGNFLSPEPLRWQESALPITKAMEWHHAMYVTTAMCFSWTCGGHEPLRWALEVPYSVREKNWITQAMLHNLAQSLPVLQLEVTQPSQHSEHDPVSSLPQQDWSVLI